MCEENSYTRDSLRRKCETLVVIELHLGNPHNLTGTIVFDGCQSPDKLAID